MAKQTYYGDPIALLGGDPPEFDVEDIVSFRTPYEAKDMVACRLRHCHQPHKRGRFVTLISGEESALGGHCAKGHMGEDIFAAFEARMIVAQRAELARSAIANPNFHPDKALEITRSWYEIIKVVDTAQRHFRNHHSRTWDMLAAIAAGSGVLATCRWRNSWLEYGHYDDFGDWHVKRTTPVAKKPDQVLQGGSFLSKVNISGLFTDLDRLLDSLAALYNGQVEPTEKQLLAVPKEIERAYQLAAAVIDCIDGYVAFTQNVSLKAVGRWMVRIADDEMKVDSTAEGLVISHYIESTGKWLNQVIPLPSVEPLDASVLDMLINKPVPQAA